MRPKTFFGRTSPKQSSRNYRRLSIEALERRSLLSVSLGISPSVLSVSAGGTTQAPPVAQQQFADHVAAHGA